MENIMSDQLELLSWENCKKNHPAFRHAFQDTAEDFVPDRHEFMRRIDVEGAFPINYESHPTGRTRVGVDNPLIKELVGDLKPEQRVYREHGVAGFHIS
jgi:hypothetical protein